MITARIIADSINPMGIRLTSWVLTYPRFIHSEFMTHRVFSRNAASSRAIPLKKMIEAIEKETAQPEFWARNQAGMSGNTEVSDPSHARDLWLSFGSEAISFVEEFTDATDIHKAIANRVIEPWSHITVLATATNHHNFFALRAHPAAMPEFQVLAYRMLGLYLESKPKETAWGQWHIPKFRNAGEDLQDNHTHKISIEDQLKIATARCARLSYLTFDGEFSIEKDIELHDRLAQSGHWSPFEHCAEATEIGQKSNFDNGKFCGWQQYRKRFREENKTNVDLRAIMATKPEWITV